MEKRNIPYFISWILEIFAVLLLAVFYRQPLFSVLLLLMLLLPFLSVYLTRVEMRRLTVTAECRTKEAMMGDEAVIRIRARLKGHVPLLNCRLHFTAENLYYKNPRVHELVFPAEVLMAGPVELPFTLSYAGLFVFSADTVYVTDYMHLFTFRKPCSIDLRIPVLPEEVAAPEFVCRKSVENDAEEEILSKDGELTREIREIREYRPGDRIRDIHWKLTARTGDIMVREYERTRELYFSVLPEPAPEELQKTLAVFYAVGKKLIREREPFRVLIPEREDFTSILVTEEEELKKALFLLYECPLEEAAGERYLREHPDAAGVIFVRRGRVEV